MVNLLYAIWNAPVLMPTKQDGSPLSLRQGRPVNKSSHSPLCVPLSGMTGRPLPQTFLFSPSPPHSPAQLNWVGVIRCLPPRRKYQFGCPTLLVLCPRATSLVLNLLGAYSLATEKPSEESPEMVPVLLFRLPCLAPVISSLIRTVTGLHDQSLRSIVDLRCVP